MRTEGQVVSSYVLVYHHENVSFSPSWYSGISLVVKLYVGYKIFALWWNRLHT